MKLLKTIIAATALFGMMATGAYADRGDRHRDHRQGHSDRYSQDHRWKHRGDGHRHDYRRPYQHHHYRYARPWMPPPPAFWYWDGRHRHHRHHRW